MLKIYRNNQNLEKTENLNNIKYSVSIDTGVNTGGITILDHLNKKWKLISYEEDFNAMESSFPLASKNYYHATEKYLTLIKDGLKELDINDIKEVLFCIEYTGTWGQFSIGLLSFLTLLYSKILDLNVGGVILIPPIVGKTFILDKYSKEIKTQSNEFMKNLLSKNEIKVSKTELKKMVEDNFMEILPKKSFKSKKLQGVIKSDFTHHMGDSLLISCFLFYDFYKNYFPSLTFSKPSYMIVDI